MDPVKQLEINGRKYTLRMPDATTAFFLFHALTHARDNNENIAPIIKQILDLCSDHMMRDLSNSENFNKCFAEHPEDLVELQDKALEAVITPFTRKSGATKPITRN